MKSLRNNENSGQVSSIHLGSLTTNGHVVPAINFPKKSVIKSVKLSNGAVIAAHASNRVILELSNDDDEVLASFTNKAAPDGQGALAANVASDFDFEAQTVEAGTNLKLSYAEFAGVAEVFRITVPEDMVGADLQGSGFTCADEVASVDFWFDLNNDGDTEPVGVGAATRGIQIDTIDDADDAEDIVAKLITAIDADAKFLAIEDPADPLSVLVTSSTVGTRTDVADGLTTEATGLGFEVVTQGVAASSAIALTDAKLLIEHYPL